MRLAPPPALTAILAALLGLVLLGLPAFLFWDQLQGFRLRDDDFAFLIACRTGAAPFAGLFEPHNAHVVPLFRLLTAGLARLAGSPGNVPWALGMGTYLGLASLMLGVGHLAAWESRRLAAGLAAMTLVGLTSVLEPATTWYAAGQTIWAAVVVVGALAALQAWRMWGGRAWIVLAGLACLAAPFVWSGGLVAGPACAAYLWASRDRAARRAALVPVGAGAVAGLVVAVVALPLASKGGPVGTLAPGRAIVHTLRAVPESLVFKNLGLDVPTTAAQGVFLSTGLALAWGWSRRRTRPPNPLEAAGATISALGYLLAYTLRGGYEFESLRPLGWYDTIPQVGAVIFAVGWWAGLRGLERPGQPAPPTAGSLLVVAGLAGVLLVLDLPRVERLTIAEAPPLLPSERERFLIDELKRLRARYYFGEMAQRQSRALVRMSKAAEYARRRGIGREAIRSAFGRVELPGWPRAIADRDALDLLDFPDDGPEAGPRDLAVLAPLLAPEPHPPPWPIAPGEPWPPPDTPLPDPVVPAGDRGDDGGRPDTTNPTDGPASR